MFIALFCLEISSSSYTIPVGMPKSFDPRPKPLIMGPTQKYGKYGCDMFTRTFPIEVIYLVEVFSAINRLYLIVVIYQFETTIQTTIQRVSLYQLTD